MADGKNNVRLRISGLGHSIDIEVDNETVIGQIQSIVSTKTGIPAPYVLLLSRGKKLTDRQMSLADLGIQDRTRLMLMHGPDWHTDSIGASEIMSVSKSLDELESRTNEGGGEVDPVVVDEMVTQACIKLDAVDVGGSETLRELRKATLRRAEELAEKYKRVR